MRNLPNLLILPILIINAHALLAADQKPHSEPQFRPAQAQDTCDQSPPDDYRRTIRAPVDGDELAITVSGRFAGAVESLTWRGKEFINIFDHGRQISYAWQMDGWGECFNPTEPGSASDLFSLSSTSELLEVCSPAENTLTTVNRPAYWLAPGETGFCDGGATTAVNEALVADQLLEKTIEIGYAGIDNVIVFTATITNLQDHHFLQAELPTGYLREDFTSYWVYNPESGQVIQPESEPLVEPWSFVHTTRMPPILATEDGAYAMGVYSVEDFTAYEILFYDVPDPEDRTNKWNVVLHESPFPAGAYTYTTFVVVGDLEAVTESLDELFRLHPTDFNPPEGFIDLVACDVIEGWGWDPKTPDEPVEIEVRLAHADGSETILTRVLADRFRSDLAEALGDNGRHGFSLPTGEIAPDGGTYRYRFYALNSNPRLPPQTLFPMEHELTCPQFSATATSPPTAAGPTPTPAQPATAPPPSEGSGGLPCASAALPMLMGLLVFTKTRRKT